MTLPDFLTQETDGEIHLTGHRIGLYTVVRRSNEGLSAEQIAAEFPSLPPALVAKVLAFYRANRPEVDAYVADYGAELERQAATHAPGPGAVKIRGLLDRVRQADARHEADPAWASLSLLEKVRRIEQDDLAERP